MRKGRTARDKIQSAYNAYAKQMVTDDLKRYFAANINYHYNSVITKNIKLVHQIFIGYI